METNLLNQNGLLRSEAIKNGVIMAAVSLVIFLAINYTVPHLMGSTALSIVNIVVGIALAVFFSLDMRKKAGGYWTFSEALLHIFIMFLVSAAIVYVFTILFGKFIDPTYPERMKELIAGKTEDMLTKLGVDDSRMEEMIATQNQQMESQFNPTLFQAIVGFGIQAIMYGIGAMIFAAIFKKARPMFVSDEN
ncbi:DUF4199 domain-containing protein [Pedobacter antarcticus]|uniref:DUF4199 domain-containing protein n=2 Tax=Pedobacter antarcticus TaxID=34086 RepID=A0A081PFB4_9SPHI|nr:DUF4199 domain-containing protein [Pedobacter antarcticus]KEQ29387.1 hypothetical protein N180_13220 [Pedobacter antarcticus 4BY]SDM66835.1 Protein of unknown function [Pedobacter antarcticus]SFF40371.1 Protein of unknown function [Pedobacter antarcticus]